MLRNYQFRVYLNRKQEAKLQQTLGFCCDLYNAALEQRIWAYKKCKVSLSNYTQNNELPELKEYLPEYKEIHSNVLQEVMARLQKAYQNFFRRLKNGSAKVGFPRFRSYYRYNSITYVQTGFKIDEESKTITLSKIGTFKVKFYRTLPGLVKRLTLKRLADGYYVSIICEVEPKVLPKTGKTTAVDMGLKHIMVDQNGNQYGDLTYLKSMQEKSIRLQQELSRKVKGSNRRKKARSRLVKHELRKARVRAHQLHNLSRKLIRENDKIIVENLDIEHMKNKKYAKKPKTKREKKAQITLRRNINEAAWGILTEQLQYKAEEAGREVVLVNPKNTSQICSVCGSYVKKEWYVRVHDCPFCGTVMDRDHNAAQNILCLGTTGALPALRQVGGFAADST